jgi:hypothetical protein
MFRIQGGVPFTFQLEGNPTAVHDGVASLFHLMLTEAQKDELCAVIEEHGCEILDVRAAQKQTEEQKAERDKLRGIGREDKVWPTALCPECFWFDPTQDDETCGYIVWTVETIEAALDSHKKARADVLDCPRGLKDIAGLDTVDPED